MPSKLETIVVRATAAEIKALRRDAHGVSLSNYLRTGRGLPALGRGRKPTTEPELSGKAFRRAAEVLTEAYSSEAHDLTVEPVYE